MSENQNVEWKESWRDEYLKWVCGFANAQGGVLEVGRNDRGEVIGVKDVLRLLDEIPNKAQALLGIMVDVNLKTESGREYLQIVVDPYPNPISYKGEFHYRSGSTRQVLRGAALNRFLLKKYGRKWDDEPLPGVGLKDLDGRTLEEFRRRAAASERLTRDILEESDAGVIEKLRLREGEYLKRAAMLLFHPEPGRFVRDAYVKIGYFPRRRVAVPGRDRRRPVRAGRPHHRPAVFQVFAGTGFLRRQTIAWRPFRCRATRCARR